MDTLIGKFKLKENQILNIPTLQVAPFKGVSYNHDSGELVAVSESKPTQDEIDSMIKSVESLPDDLDKSVAKGLFDSIKAKQDFYQTLGASIASLAPYWGVLSDMITFRNFDGIKAYADGLIGAGVLTSDQYKIINGIFKTQNIDLDNI